MKGVVGDNGEKSADNGEDVLGRDETGRKGVGLLSPIFTGGEALSLFRDGDGSCSCSLTDGRRPLLCLPPLPPPTPMYEKDGMTTP